MSDLPREVGERGYRRIRADILFGRLPPGQRLRLDALRESYGVSVATLREILNRLSSEGLVVAEGQRGFAVEPVSPGGFRDVAALRLLLERHALRASFAAGDLDWEGDVVAAHHKLATLERVMAAGERSAAETWKRYDREFHVALISACGSRALLEAHAAVYDKYVRYQMVFDIYRGERAEREHLDLLDAARRRDAAGADRALTRHVEECVETALARAPDRPPRAARAGAVTAPPATPGDSAYRRLRADILSGALSPGRRLRLECLRAEYQVGVGTLREALSRLSSETLVVAEGQRGFEVAPISANNLREIAALRELLESSALGQSFARGDLEWEARVVAAHHKLAALEERMEAGDRSVTGAWKQYDWQFHQALVSACGSRMLTETHAAVFDKYFRYQMIALGFRPKVAAAEHRELLRLALVRDVAGAPAVLARHIEGGVEQALRAGAIPG